MWEHRNGEVHGHTKAQERTKRLEALRSECLNMCSNRPVVAAEDRHLLSTNLSMKNGMYLHHWKRAVKTAIAKEKIRRKNQARMNIEEYFARTRLRMSARGNTGRQRSMTEFLVGNARAPTTLDRHNDYSGGGRLRGIQILAQCEIAKNGSKQTSDAEERP